jgi:group II intron reverse transcriptase/maturase
MERRASVIKSDYFKTTLGSQGKMMKEMTKSLPVSKRMVYNSYLKVSAKGGSAGIDKVSIEKFDANLPKNLYKVWNRMTSGSYFPPPVRTVFIPKKQGGMRPLGIPTVSDRIAQGVVKDYLEPTMEMVFNPYSYGYRPGRSAHGALQQCLDNCIKYSWVIDVDIKGFFDNLSHTILMRLLSDHTQEKWIHLYVERWLKAGIEQEDGSIKAREKGTPQGGVISPLLANMYLHHAFDKWMRTTYRGNPFERYADDIVIHCESKEQSEELLGKLKERLSEYALELHPDKTKIVYCYNYFRQEKHKNRSFTFLSYSFHPRTIRDKYDPRRRLLVFGAEICQKAKTSIREQLRQVLQVKWNLVPLEWFAKQLNPKIRGWVNYYAKFHRWKALKVFHYLNGLICAWIKHTYKLIGKGKVKAKYRTIQAANPCLFYHWTLGIK